MKKLFLNIMKLSLIPCVLQNIHCSKNENNSSPTTNTRKEDASIKNTLTPVEAQSKILDELTFLTQRTNNPSVPNRDQTVAVSAANLSTTAILEKIQNSVTTLKAQPTSVEVSDLGFERDEQAIQALDFLWQSFFKEAEIFFQKENSFLSNIQPCEGADSTKSYCFEGEINFSKAPVLFSWLASQLQLDKSKIYPFRNQFAANSSTLKSQITLAKSLNQTDNPKQLLEITLDMDYSRHQSEIKIKNLQEKEDMRYSDLLEFKFKRNDQLEGLLTWKNKTGSKDEYSNSTKSQSAAKFAWIQELEPTKLWTRYIKNHVEE